jgi:hypothetical protein
MGKRKKAPRISFHEIIRPATRSSYWSISKFSKFLKKLAGIESPFALTIEQWDEYYDNFKKKAPFTYFVVESLLPSLQNIVYLPYDICYGIHIYYLNAIKGKVHYLKTNLPIGRWYDTDIRLLCANMNALVDYVEIELAHLYSWGDDTEWVKLDFSKYGRSEMAGKLYLEGKLAEEFESPEVDDPEFITEVRKSFDERKQAYADILEIYCWWKEYFANSIMAYDESDKDLEDKYLKKLVDLRHYLWT